MKPVIRIISLMLMLTAVSTHAIAMRHDQPDSALHLAGYNVSLSQVQFLIKHKANINITDQQGNTPLMDAARRGQLEIVKLLLKSNADIQLKNEEGNTALDLAKFNDFQSIVELLEQRQAQALLKKEINTLLSAHSSTAPGIAVLVRQNDQAIIKAAKGMATPKLTITTETPFRIASMSKPFTAIAIMQLVDSGKLRLNAPVTDYVSQLKDSWNSITIADLLSHRVSINKDFFDDAQLAIANLSSNQTVIDFINQPNIKVSQLTQDKAQYCNSCYVLLAETVANASGIPFKAYMQQHIFTPAQMANTYILDSPEIYRPDMALNYAKTRGFLGIEQFTTGAMAQVSSLNDLEQFVIALKSSKLIKPKSLTLMTQPHSELIDGGAYGYGWIIGWGKNPFFSHGGDQDSYRTELFIDPKHDLEVAILSNGGEQSFQLISQIMKRTMFHFKQ